MTTPLGVSGGSPGTWENGIQAAILDQAGKRLLRCFLPTYFGNVITAP